VRTVPGKIKTCIIAVIHKTTATLSYLNRFGRFRQAAPMYIHSHLTHASLDPPESIPHKVSRSVPPFFPQLTAEGPYTLYWATPFPLKIALVHGGFGPASNICFIGPTPLNIPNGISIGSAVFAQLTAGSPCTLQWAASFPLKIDPLRGEIWTLSNTWFLVPTPVYSPKYIAIGSVVNWQ